MELRAWYVNAYLRHGYVADADFLRALDDLYAQHRAAIAKLARRGIRLNCVSLYRDLPDLPARVADSIRAIRAFVSVWALDRLVPEGADTLCAWLMAHQWDGKEPDTVAEIKPEITVRDLRDAMAGRERLGDPYVRDEDGAVVFAPRIVASEFADFAMAMIPEPLEPWMHPDAWVKYTPDGFGVIVEVDGETVGSWIPDEESIASIKNRLHQRVRPDQRETLYAQIEGIAQAYEDAGAAFPDTADNLPQTAARLYQRVRYRRSCIALAVEADPEDESGLMDARRSEAIKKATNRLARYLEIEIPPPRLYNQNW